MNTPFGTIGRLVAITLMGLVLAGCQTTRPIHTQIDVQLADEEAYRQFWLHANKIRPALRI